MVNCMNLILILKGFIVGIGKIIPGVSGSMLAITLGVYERVLEAITNFFSNPKQNIKLLVNFSFGLFLAIIFFSRLILFSLNNYYDETMFLFIGLFRMINSNKKPHFKILMMYLTVKLLTVQISSSIIQIVLSFVLFLLCDKFDEIQKKRKQILLDRENI